VAGVDLSDFSLSPIAGASGRLSAITAINANGGYASTYQITASDLSGEGSLQLNVNVADSGIRDRAGNPLAASSAESSAQINTANSILIVKRVQPAAPSKIKLATDNIINAAELASAGVSLSGTTAGIESGQVITLTVFNGSSPVFSTTATV
jgi:hypothetical protein